MRRRHVRHARLLFEDTCIVFKDCNTKSVLFRRREPKCQYTTNVRICDINHEYARKIWRESSVASSFVKQTNRKFSCREASNQIESAHKKQAIHILLLYLNPNTNNRKKY
jgi:hypothetical protein